LGYGLWVMEGGGGLGLEGLIGGYGRRE
jgi:hypothetical protein